MSTPRIVSIGLFFLALFSPSGCSRSDDAAPDSSTPELVLHVGHVGAVSAVTFSPDGRTLVSAGVDGSIRLWDASSGELKYLISDKRALIQSLEYSPDGIYLASRSGDDGMYWGGEVMLRDARTRKAVRVWPARAKGDSGNGILAFAFAPNSKTIALANWIGNAEQSQMGQSQITLWDIASGKQTSAVATLKRRTRSLAFSHNGKLLAAVTENGSTLLYDVATRKLKRTFTRPQKSDLRGHDNGLFSVAFSPDDKTLAAMGMVSEEMTAATIVWMWDVTSGKLKTILPGAGVGTSFAFSRDGKTLISAGSMLGASAIIFWDVATGKDKRIFWGGAGMPVPIALSPNGKTLATANSKQSSLAKMDAEAWKTCMGDIQLMDAASGKVLHTMRGYAQVPVEAAAFSPDGKSFVSIHTNLEEVNNTTPSRNIRAWDTHTVRLLATWQGDAPIAFSRDGKLLATADSVSHIATTQYTNGKNKIVTEKHLERVPAVTLRDTQTGKAVQTFRVADDSEVSSIALSPNGNILATMQYGAKTSAQDYDPLDRWGVLKLWDATTGKLLHTLRTFTSYPQIPIAFSPDGNVIATGGETQPDSSAGAVQLWNARSGKLVRVLKGGDMPSGASVEAISALTFAPDSKTIFGRTTFAWVQWDIQTGKRLRVVETTANIGNSESGSDNSATTPLSISPDGRIITTETDDYSVKLWDAQTSKLLRELKGHNTGVLALAFSQDSKVLLSGSNDGTMKFWNSQSGDLLLTIAVIGVSKSKAGTATDWIAFTPDGKYDGSAGVEKFIRWRVGDELLPAAKFQAQRHRPDAIAIALSAPR